MAWEELSAEEREYQIFDALVLNEIGQVDRLFCNRYIDAKARITDVADRMRLDIQYFERVGQLRRERKISPAEVLREKARSMVDMSSDEMREALHEHEIEVPAAD